MGWYDSNFYRRTLISIDNSAGSSPGDVNITLPKDHDEFWTTIDSSGVELRVVSFNSNTLLNYSVDDGSGGAFTKSTRKGRIQIDGMTLPSVAGSTVAAWLYYGTASAQGSAAVATTISGAINGYIELGAPGQHQIVYRPQIPGQTRPRFTIHKRANEEMFVWFNYSDAMQLHLGSARNTIYYEEPYYGTVSVLDTAGSDTASMYDTSKNRLVWWNRDYWFKVLVKAGTTANKYTVVPELYTMLTGGSGYQQRLISTLGLDVRDTRH